MKGSVKASIPYQDADRVAQGVRGLWPRSASTNGVSDCNAACERIVPATVVLYLAQRQTPHSPIWCCAMMQQVLKNNATYCVGRHPRLGLVLHYRAEPDPCSERLLLFLLQERYVTDFPRATVEPPIRADVSASEIDRLIRHYVAATLVPDLSHPAVVDHMSLVRKDVAVYWVGQHRYVGPGIVRPRVPAERGPRPHQSVCPG